MDSTLRNLPTPSATTSPLTSFFIVDWKAACPTVSGSDPGGFSRGDGRYLIIENVSNCDQFYIKGQRFDLGDQADPELAERFEGAV